MGTKAEAEENFQFPGKISSVLVGKGIPRNSK